MNNNLSTHSLVAKNKAQLLEMMQEALDYAQDGGEVRNPKGKPKGTKHLSR